MLGGKLKRWRREDVFNSFSRVTKSAGNDHCFQGRANVRIRERDGRRNRISMTIMMSTTLPSFSRLEEIRNS